MMLQLEEKKFILASIQKSIQSGARSAESCKIVGISTRTFQRWVCNLEPDKRPTAKRKVSHKLREDEVKDILSVCNSPEYRDRNPHEIVALLAEKGIYLASERTFYRILKAHSQLTHRRKSKLPTKRKPKETHVATRPCQVLSWDITYMKTNVIGRYYYLYLFLDVWSRKILGWRVEDAESSLYSKEAIADIAKRYELSNTVLHSDNGSPMKGSTMLATLHNLGISSSFSRPSVSQDNAYSESLFKTLKYKQTYPDFFASIDEARTWVADFVDWYNNDHLHSAIGFVTPNSRHNHEDISILKARSETYNRAYALHPKRWSGKPKSWERKEVVILNGQREEALKRVS